MIFFSNVQIQSIQLQKYLNSKSPVIELNVELNHAYRTNSAIYIYDIWFLPVDICLFCLYTHEFVTVVEQQ